MSSPNFLQYKNRFADFTSFVDAIQEWANKHPDKMLYDPTRIAYEQNLDSAVPITFILSTLKEQGLFALEYHIRFPTEWTISEQVFENTEDIPITLYDSNGVEFSIADASVIPAYRRLG